MNSASELLASSQVLSWLAQTSGLPDLALVGGTIRDWLLDRPHLDLDLCVAGDPRVVAQALRSRLGGSWYVLDPDFDVVRYTPPRTPLAGGPGRLEPPMTVDLARRQGESWEADLARRDLSINAIAVPLTASGRAIEPVLLDPTGGLADLEGGIVRAVSPQSLEADPVRLLRVYRFAAALRFQVSPQTRIWVADRASAILQTAPERIRDEFFKLLAADSSSPIVADLAQVGLLEVLLPELSWLRGTASIGHFDGFTHKLESLRALDDLLVRLAQWAPQETGVEAHLAQSITADRPVKALMALAVLVCDLDSHSLEPPTNRHPVAQTVGRRLRLSGREIRWLLAARAARPRFEELLVHGPRGAALYRYFKDAQDTAIGVALWALADFLAARDLTVPGAEEGPWAAARAVFIEHSRPEITAPGDPLIRGDDLREVLDLPRGPRIAELLEGIAEARADGKISSRTAAIDLARSWQSGPEPS